MSYKPERALTQDISPPFRASASTRRNELQAREGIDTLKPSWGLEISILCRNELQAREGIDTVRQGIRLQLV